jgi:4-amino-4-deoxy-L-arabinose transferase-like glycosyltransferase
MIAYLLGKETFNREVGLLSAGITAVYSYFVYYSANLVTEPFYITGVLMVLYVSIRIVKIIAADLEAERFFDRYKLALALGISLGATVLLRQLFLLFIPFLFLWIWLSVDRSKRRAVISHFFISSIIVGAMILPFTLYNYQRFNRFVLLNTNSGYAFFWGNHPIYGSHFIPILPEEMGSYQDLIPAELLHLDEAALDQALLREGLRFIVEDPVRIILLSFSRIPAYFMFWPSHDSGLVSNVARVSGFGLFLPLMLFGIVRSLSNRKHKLAISSPEVLLLLFALIYTGIHLLTWALIRYRLPVDAVLVIFAGLAFRDLILVYQRRAGRLPEISTKPLDGR